MSFKACAKCKQVKSLDSFYKAPSSRNKDKLQSWCKDCTRPVANAYVKKRMQEIREKLDGIKLERGCADCKYNKAPEALDFDHIQNKSFTISASLSKNWESILKEIEKCEVVCANCHRIRTKKRNELQGNRCQYG